MNPDMLLRLLQAVQEATDEMILDERTSDVMAMAAHRFQDHVIAFRRDVEICKGRYNA